MSIAHYTVQQYLLGDDSGDFHFSTADADETAADTCLAYLNFANFQGQLTTFNENAGTDLAALQRIAGSGQILSLDNPGRTILSS